MESLAVPSTPDNGVDDGDLDSEFISDPYERRKVQNRKAQKKHRQKMKERMEELEKRVDSHLPPLRHGNNHPITEQQSIDFTASNFLPDKDPRDEAMYFDLNAEPLLQPTLALQSNPGANRHPIMQDAWSRGLEIVDGRRSSSAARAYTSQSRDLISEIPPNSPESRDAPEYLQQANHPSLGNSNSALMKSPRRSYDSRKMQPEDRMGRILDFIAAMGFEDFDQVATEYYKGDFDQLSSVSAAQRTSRSRRLRGLLENLRTSAVNWSEYESHDYRHETSKSAESIYVRELENFESTLESSTRSDVANLCETLRAVTLELPTRDKQSIPTCMQQKVSEAANTSRNVDFQVLYPGDYFELVW